MSNPGTAFGFEWIGPSKGGPAVNGIQRKMKLYASNNTPIYFGDVVRKLTTGYVGVSAQGVTGGNTAGIFVGCEYLSTARGNVIESSYWPSGDHAYDGWAYIIPIADAVPQLFKVMSGNYSSQPFTSSLFGQTVDLNAGSGSVTGGYGRSGMYADGAYLGGTGGASSTYPFKVVDLYSSYVPSGIPGTDDSSANNIVIVESNPFASTTI